MTIDYSKSLPDLTDVIREIDPTAVVIIDDDDVDKIQWLDGTTAIDKSVILAKKAEIDVEWSKNKYQRDRKEDFRQLGIATELDLLWHDIDAGKFGDAAKTGEWYKDVKAVKDRFTKTDYPKE